MNAKALAIATFLLAFCATSAVATPITASFDVDANDHVWNDGVGNSGNLGLDTEIFFDLGDAFMIDVDNVADTWNLCLGGLISSCEVNADGERGDTTDFGDYTSSSFTAVFGTLVGRVGAGDFFVIGTGGFDGAANAAGELTLFNWDHNTNNGGIIAATVSYSVPAPGTLALFALGMAAARVVRRRTARRG